MKNNKKLFVFIFILSLFSGVLSGIKYLSYRHEANQPKIIINQQTIYLEVVKNAAERTKGLSGRETMEKNQGMLFIFDEPGNYQFWMKEMKFSLDVVFIRGNQIVDIIENVPFPKEQEQPQVMVANERFEKVLELNSGIVKILKIKIGDPVKIFLASESNL